MAQNKTQPTNESVQGFLQNLSKQRQTEASQLITIMAGISGQPAIMWGPSIIGFGSQHYKYETGREGNIPILAFSPRKAAITIYFYEGFDNYATLLEALGKHSTSVSCLYIPKLADVELSVLKQMLVESFRNTSEVIAKPLTTAQYISQVPAASRARFDELREIVRGELPQAIEVLSYGVLGYKIDDRRARVFVSGWKDHVAMYPVPKDEELQRALEPYRKGKGTLWFALDQPLPAELIRQTVRALTA